MANILRIRRRLAGGAAGAPSSLENAELAFNEQDMTLYYGVGTGGAGGSATSIAAIGGPGAFLTLGTTQTVTGNKTFSGTVDFGTNTTGVTQSTADNSTKLATTAFVKAQGYLTANQTITLSGDVTGSGTTAITTTIAANAVTLAKFQQVATGSVLGRNTAGTGNIEVLTTLPNAVMPAHTGDVTSSAGSVALTIAANAVTFAKMQQIATATVLGRSTAGSGNIEILTTLPVAVMPAHTGDVTSSAGSVALTIGNNVVTYAKFQQVASVSLVGNPTGGTANAQAITLGGGLEFSGTTLRTAAHTGDVTSAAGSLAMTIANSAVTLAKMANLAANSIIGNNTGSPATPVALTTAQVKTLLAIVAADISNFDTQVRTSRLDQMAAPTASVSMNSQRITNLATPVNDGDAATKAYVDSISSGLDVKGSVRVATAAALPAYTRSGNVLTANANGALAAVDGVTLGLNDRVLVKNGAAGADNGIYFVSQVGDVGTPWTLTRTVDADTSAEVTSGLFVFVEEGTTNSDTGWILTTNNPITLNTTALTFTQFSGAGSYLAGTGLTLTGTTFSVNASQTQITAIGTITTGTWQATAIGTQWGGTGMNNSALAADRYLYTSGTGTFAAGTITSFARGLLDDTDAATMRTTLGLVIGTNVQAYDAELAALAGLTSAADRLPYFTGSGTAALAVFTGAARNLLDDADATAMRTTLGLGTLATLSTVTLTTNVTGLLPVANGGTGVGTLTGLVKGNGTSAFSAAVAGTDYHDTNSTIDGGTF